jgi:hypothetical protein
MGGGNKKLPSGKPDAAANQAAMLTAFLRGEPMPGAGLIDEDEVVAPVAAEPSALGAAVLKAQGKAMGLGDMPRTAGPARAPRTPLAKLINRPRTMVPGGRPKGL